MKEINLVIFLIFISSIIKISAQPLGLNDINVGIHFGKINGNNKIGSFAVATNMHCSLIDYLIQGKIHKFRFGDYLGLRASTGIPSLTTAIDLGGQVAYGSERMNIGYKYIYKMDAVIGETGLNGFSKVWAINTRVEDIYLELFFSKEAETNIKGFSCILRFMAPKKAYYGLEYNRYPLNYSSMGTDKYARLFSINMGWMF